LALVGIDREPDETLRAEGLGHGVRIGVGLAVVRKLEVRVRGERRFAGIAQLERHVDYVAAATEGIDLLHLDAVLARRAEAQLEGILPRRELARPRQHTPQGAMVRAGFARQAALRLVVVRGAEQRQVLAEIL